MPLTHDSRITEIINNPDTVKVLSTVNADGTPHAAVLETLRLNADGALEYLELLESSRSYRNLTAALWYDTVVSVVLSTPGGVRYQIKGKPVRITICGPYFEERYVAIREELGDVDLAAVCFIKVLEIEEETFAVRFAQQEAQHPFYKHLDRLADKAA
jgi:hypothetical protein